MPRTVSMIAGVAELASQVRDVPVDGVVASPRRRRPTPARARSSRSTIARPWRTSSSRSCASRRVRCSGRPARHASPDRGSSEVSPNASSSVGGRLRRSKARRRAIELVRVERLDEVVVRAGLEPLHALLHCVACGEQQHRQREALGADAPGHREPVHRRHRDVEHHDVGHRALHPDERVASAGRALHRETGTFQHASEHAQDAGIVVDDEHGGRHVCSSPKVAPTSPSVNGSRVADPDRRAPESCSRPECTDVRGVPGRPPSEISPGPPITSPPCRICHRSPR